MAELAVRFAFTVLNRQQPPRFSPALSQGRSNVLDGPGRREAAFLMWGPSLYVDCAVRIAVFMDSL
jgi:hypothetical protein